jgi:hypothetical protein
MIVVVLKTVSNIMFEDVDGTRAMLGTEPVGWRFHCIPGNHDLGGGRKENTSLAPNGAYMLVRVGLRDKERVGK